MALVPIANRGGSVVCVVPACRELLLGVLGQLRLIDAVVTTRWLEERVMLEGATA